MNTAEVFLRSSRGRLGLDRFGDPDRWVCVLVTPRFEASAHVVFLFLDPRTAEPALVVKAPRSPAGERSVVREARALKLFGRRCPPLRGSVPELLACETFGGTTLLVETGLAGRPLSPALVRSRPEIATLALTRWVETVGTHTLGDPESGPSTYEALLSEPLVRHEERFSSDARERRLVTETLRLFDGLKPDLPTVFEHGDLSAPNLLLDRSGELAVVDWELAESAGLAGTDLFFGLQYLASARVRAQTVRAHEKAFEEAFVGARGWARPHALRYAERLGFSPALLPLLLVACWARAATRLSDRLDSADAPSEAGRPWIRSHRYRALWERALDASDRLAWRPTRMAS